MKRGGRAPTTPPLGAAVTIARRAAAKAIQGYDVDDDDDDDDSCAVTAPWEAAMDVAEDVVVAVEAAL